MFLDLAVIQCNVFVDEMVHLTIGNFLLQLMSSGTKQKRHSRLESFVIAENIEYIIELHTKRTRKESDLSCLQSWSISIDYAATNE